MIIPVALPHAVVKQEHRDETDLPVGPPAALSQTRHLARSRQPSPPNHLQPHDTLLSSSPQSLVAGLPAPQQVYPHLGAPSFQQLSPLEAHGLGPDCQMVGAALGYTTAPPPPCPAYQSIPCSLRYNGQPSLPMPTTSPQAYEPITTYQLEPATSHPLNLGVLYHSTLGTASTSAPPGPLTLGSSHLHSLAFPGPNPGPAPCPSYPNTASCPSTATAPPPTVPSPHSGPSSPQLPPLPYQSPNGGSASSPSPTSSSPLMHLPCSGQASPQASSPGMGGLASAGALCPPLTPRSPFSPEGERLHIKQEPEDKELTFQSIGLQDITLDDGRAPSYSLVLFFS